MGSFGTVCKAKVDDFICAAKSLQPLLSGGESVTQKFREECEFLSALRHPNIVQYLGVHEDPDTRQPLLLMELMNDENLTQFLDNSPSLLPFHVEVNICHDVAQALAYLHSNRVIHRDLSGSNVLLMGNVLKAKICDFGTARLLDLTPGYRQVLTMCPGNPAYMPPEALRDNPKYDEKLDCFSFGVLIVQVLTRLFPHPGDRNEPVQDGRYGGTVLMRLVPEMERRRNHISLVDPEDPLLGVALECLKDESFERPSAQQLCESVGALRDTRLYRESEVFGNRAWRLDAPSEGDRPEFQSIPASSAIRTHHTTDIHKQCQKCEEKSAKIIALSEQIKEKAILLEDVFMNASIQEKFQKDTKAKLEEERRISAHLRSEVSRGQADMRQLQQELAHYKGQCEELTRQNEFERQQRYASEMELQGLRQECAQNRNLVASLQQQLREAKQNEWQVYQELMQTKDELSKCEEDRIIATREKDELSSRLVELTRERDNFNPRLREMSSEIERLREDLARTRRERREAVEERDRSIRQKDSQIHDLEGQLREANPDAQEHITKTTQTLLLLGDGWNVPREEIELIPNREIGRGASGLVLEGRYKSQVVAVKQIHQNILQNSAIVEEFRREIGIMASVKHPNLVRFVAAVFDDAVLNLDETPLLVSELLNTSLRKAYERGNVEGQYLKHSIFRDVAYGLHYLHEHQEPIIHRDISSANILLEALSGGIWRAKLSDFGSANFLKQAKTLGVGAIVYMAPEVFPRDDPNAPMPHSTTKCDVFSYGIVLVEVITKMMPSQENRHQLFEEARVKWPLMHELASQCAEVAPEARPTMSEVLNTLNRIPIARPRVRSFPSLS